MKTVARIVTRMQGNDDGLFLGALFKGGRDYFKPNTIYEIKDILGALTIVEVGRATGAGPDNCSSLKLDYSKVQFSWCSDIGYVMSLGGRQFLTEKEYLGSLNKEE
jgi:hypothetical protein